MTKRSLAAAGSALLLLAGCGAGHSKNKAADEGQVHLQTRTQVHAQALTTGGPPAVCGAITLQPYSLDAAGNLTLAGAPVTLSSSAAAGTDEILGCIDNGAAGNNWGYLVTATGWNDCGTPAAALANVQPPTVSGNFPVHCSKSLDTALPILLNVSVPTENSAGYIDISVTVNSTTVQTGCKVADLNPATGKLNFGQSFIDPTGRSHDGIVGLNAGTPLQYGGVVSAGLPAQDTFYTGQVGPTIPSLVFQTFVDTCREGGEFVDTNHAQCVTTSGGMTGLTTANALADAFFSDPAWGYASATITSGGAIQIYWSGESGATLMDASATPATLGFNGVTAQTLTPAVGTTYTGLYIDLTASHQFLVTGLGAGGVPFFASISESVGAWTVDPSAPLPSLAEQRCLGLFQSQSNGCVRPHLCVNPGVVEVVVTREYVFSVYALRERVASQMMVWAIMSVAKVSRSQAAAPADDCGTIDAATGRYTAPAHLPTGNCRVVATDLAGRTGTADVMVIAAP